MSEKLVKVTFYGFPDNDDGEGHFNTAIIAHKLTWQGRPRNVDPDGEPIAGGTGTFEDPITAAATAGNSFLKRGTAVYVPGIEKYFLIEDECASCDRDEWIDLWIQSFRDNDTRAVLACEDDWTSDDTVPKRIIVDPSPSLPVDLRPFFDTRTNVCRIVEWKSIP